VDDRSTGRTDSDDGLELGDGTRTERSQRAATGSKHLVPERQRRLPRTPGANQNREQLRGGEPRRSEVPQPLSRPLVFR
jgi:hypothetical protein